MIFDMVYAPPVFLLRVFFVLVLFFLPFYYSYHLYRTNQYEISRILHETKREEKKKLLLAQIEKYVHIPSNEQVQVVFFEKKPNGTLPFFDIRNGDFLIIFVKAKVGIVYQPTTDSIRGIVSLTDSQVKHYEAIAY